MPSATIWRALVARLGAPTEDSCRGIILGVNELVLNVEVSNGTLLRLEVGASELDVGVGEVDVAVVVERVVGAVTDVGCVGALGNSHDA
jgi:hypothetical protein